MVSGGNRVLIGSEEFLDNPLLTMLLRSKSWPVYHVIPDHLLHELDLMTSLFAVSKAEAPSPIPFLEPNSVQVPSYEKRGRPAQNLPLGSLSHVGLR